MLCAFWCVRETKGGGGESADPTYVVLMLDGGLKAVKDCPVYCVGEWGGGEGGGGGGVMKKKKKKELKDTKPTSTTKKQLQ